MEYVESEEYILLNFKDKIDQKFFNKPKMFFKMVNLESKNPFVQVGSHVFSAKFDEDFLGTSLIFEEQKDPPKDYDSIFERETAIHLKYLAKTSKSMSLHWVKVPEEVININPSELVDLEFNNTYETVLSRIEDGSIDMADIIKKPPPPESERVQLSIPAVTPGKPDNENDNSDAVIKQEGESMEIDETRTLDESGEVHLPTLKLLNEFVNPEIQDPQYYNNADLDSELVKNDREFLIFKEVYLKSFNYNKMAPQIEKRGIGQYVDVKASVADGIINVKPGQKSVKLDDATIRKLTSLKNFDNFNEELKILVLIDYLQEEKAELGKMTEEELATEDEYGRTPKKRYKMVKSLVNDMKYNLYAKTYET